MLASLSTLLHVYSRSLQIAPVSQFALNNGNPIANSIANGEIVNPQAYEIAPAQLAIDGKIKQSKVS